MILSIIVAVDENQGIGSQNQIPWDLPLDLARFKRLTMGHHLIVGRKTYQSIGSPLPGRQMIVLTRNPDFEAEGCLTASSLYDAIQLAEEAREKEVFIIGGAELYQEALPMADHLYLTRVYASLEADTFFPEFDEEDWIQVYEQKHPVDEENAIPHTFFHYRRKPASN
ncbi:MAG: dihydrofolate reductase [Chloroflexi bacterium]|nr:dihydrofolate reductase [Chloroflexota bacterium]